jgi:hypothetical protein
LLYVPSYGSQGALVFGEVKTARREVNARGNLVVSVPSGRFRATHYKPAGRPHPILRERTKTDDHELLADAFQAAVAKARELGWIA